MDAIGRMIYYLGCFEPNSTNYMVLTELLKNVRKIPSLYIEELAAICYVAPATISRLVKKLEFRDFAHFKTEVAIALHASRSELDSSVRIRSFSMLSASVEAKLTAYVDAITLALQEYRKPDTIRKLGETAQLIQLAETVCFFVHGSMPYNSLQRKLFLDGKRAVIHKNIRDGAAYASHLHPGDVVITVINGEAELQVKEAVLRTLSAEGIHVIALATCEMPGLTDFADFVFPTFCAESHDLILFQSIFSELLLSIYEEL